jgi:hypothetical protein
MPCGAAQKELLTSRQIYLPRLANKLRGPARITLRRLTVVRDISVDATQLPRALCRHSNNDFVTLMAMVNLYEFWAELEATGEAEVRKKLAAGVYGEWKIGPVEAWLREKEAVEAHINNVLQQKTASQTVVWSRNSTLVAVVAICVAIIGLLLSYK